jgi:hypothetical protein
MRPERRIEMKTLLSLLRSSAVVISLSTVVAAQSKYEQEASLDIRIASDYASIHQMEALPIELTFVNTGAEPIGVSREIFVGAWKDYGLRMMRPVKKGDVVASEEHFAQKIQTAQSSNAGSGDWLHLPVGKSGNLRLVLSFDFGIRKPLFREPGSYSFHLEWVATGGAVRKSNELRLEVTPPPDGDKGALELLQGMDHAELLFIPSLLSQNQSDNVKAQIEKLATMGQLYSRYAKWCLAEAAFDAARIRKDWGKAENNAAETRELLRAAETLAESINSAATFRLDKELEATKARISSLKQRADGPPQR